MKKTLLVATLLLISFFSPVKAQEVDWDRFEVGVDLLWLIKRNNVPVSFFIKDIELKQRKNDFGFVRRGYRLRIGGSYQRPNEETMVSGSFYTRQSSYSFVVRPGYEWHRKVKSFDVFYGADLDFEISGSTLENASVYLQAEDFQYYYTLFNQRNRYMDIGIAPVLGMSIKIIKGLNLTLESTANISYTRDRSYYSGNQTFDDFGIEGNGFSFNLFPLYTMNASFTF